MSIILVSENVSRGIQTTQLVLFTLVRLLFNLDLPLAHTGWTGRKT
jgi:hypothetical protein